MRRWLILIALLSVAAVASAEQRFPAPEFKTGYQIPPLEAPAPHAIAWQYVDAAVLAAALAVAAWLVHKRRWRRGVFLLTIFALLYFGFWRKGCICSIGAIQNVALAAADSSYALPLGVAAFFVLPLLFALFYGRVFCAGVCPLGAIQDLVLWKPLQVPPWLEHSLSLFAYIYLGLGVLFAAASNEFVICRYDPFVGFFRLSAPGQMVFLGAVLLGIGMFVGRPYCRFICPYSVPLKLLSMFSRRRVTISPADCIDCRLCEISCPFGAIRYPAPPRVRGEAPPRRQAALAAILLPVLVGVFALLGYLGRGAMSRVDFTVRLAEDVRLQQQDELGSVSEASEAFLASGASIPALYASAARIQHRYAIGTPIFGAWVGLAIGGKLLGIALRRRHVGYTAEPGACVACARCFTTCPVEHERRKQSQPETVLA